MKKTGIIIQARRGSSRLPDKIVLPFYEGKNILQLLLQNLKSIKVDEIVVATTINRQDDLIEEYAIKAGVKCYRGDEQNVLSRFIEAAEKYELNTIVRICSDNPLLIPKYVQALLAAYHETNGDYLSFQLKDNLPIIKSHIGIFSEVTSLAALKRVAANTREPLFLEHVTNYIYTHPELFSVQLIDAPDGIYGRDDIRLTLDTADDFKLLQELYQILMQKHGGVDIPKILSVLQENPVFLDSMQKSIVANSK